jgi:hypothetical protein
LWYNWQVPDEAEAASVQLAANLREVQTALEERELQLLALKTDLVQLTAEMKAKLLPFCIFVSMLAMLIHVPGMKTMSCQKCSPAVLLRRETQPLTLLCAL